MKKLLALILCVMMFASLSVNAFAAVPYVSPIPTAAASQAVIATMRGQIQEMYTTAAADDGILAGSAVLNDVVTALAQGIADAYGTNQTAATKAAQLIAARAEYGNQVWAVVSNNFEAFTSTNALGQLVVDPVAFMNTYVAAVSAVLTDPANIAFIQASYTDALRTEIHNDWQATYNAYLAANAAAAAAFTQYIAAATGFDIRGFDPDYHVDYIWTDNAASPWGTVAPLMGTAQP